MNFEKHCNCSSNHEEKIRKELEEHSYFEKTIVNGIEISVAYDPWHRFYTIYFPQVDTQGDEAKKKDIHANVIGISASNEDAKKVFDYAKKCAENRKNVYKVYNIVKIFCENIWRKERRSRK